MEHPDILLKLYEYKHRDRVRDIDTWRLTQVARQQRAGYVGQLWQHLMAAGRQHLRVQPGSKPAKPDLANLHR